ncbi:efflux RND transporter permease subunit [Saccharophagus degradans]|uniref:Efflux RND transporter permease subunit n=1 Tax=Saccharophagus degradans TaxID=86304 RepID=A0AAW7X0P4_9GAMM|nr:efflux RND transporter permease subunit [Saccharophagus degradans]MDO6420920.1 efflux RND transporter permease subunit [Saccharophagus degradans]MDO6606169.1 efflux RND transporter permease subunit [Saccharophagus degradans]
MIEWFCKNHVAANLLLLAVVLAGLFSLTSRIPLEIFPTVESNVVQVNITLRGATPEDAELAIATRIEEAVQDLEGIEEIVSRSTEGGASIAIEVESSYDPRILLDEVKNRVDSINTLPSDAERPIISLAVRKRDVMMVTVSGDVSEREIREQVEQVRNELLLLPNVSQVDLNGVRDYEIAIELSQDSLREYGLTLSQVSNAITQSSLDLSAGNIRTDGGDILIRSKGQAYNKHEFDQIVLKTHRDGTLLKLGDIATVTDGFEETAIRTRFNGKLAAGLRVYRIGKQSAIQVAKEVREYIEQKQSTMPEGMEISYWDDDSQIVKSRIKTLTTNAVQGGILVLLLLSLFLRPAVAFWVFVGIPVSFLGAFFVMPFIGVTLNLISLFAFIVVLGIVVDDAIVTGENIYTHLRSSESGLAAAINGTKEVAVPVTFGVLTTVAAFVPLFFMGGDRGPVFAQIPAIVIPVLLFSLIESKLVLPAHLKYLKIKKDHQPNKLERIQQNIANGFERAILKYYQPALKVCTNNRLITVTCFVGILACISTAVYVGHSKFTFFPRIPSETVRVNLTLPTGTPFEVTDQYVQTITGHARSLKEKYVDENGQSIILNILSMTGGRGGASHQGEVRFEISPPESRKSTITSRELSREWRELIGEIPGAEALTFRAEIGRTSDPIDIQLRSNNFQELEIVSDKIKERLTTYAPVFDINDSLADGKEELRIELKPEAYLLGVNRAEVVQQVRQAFFGVQAQRIQRGRDDVRVMVRFPREERESIAHLNNMLIRTPSGQQVPFSHIAEYTPSQSPTAIYRIDGYRTVNVRADVDKQAANMTVLQADLEKYVASLVAQYPGMSYKMGGESEEQRESFTSLYWGIGAVILVIYALLAIPFGSYSQPLIVMSIIPFGLIGAIVGHWIMRMDLTIMSMLGMLALIGIIVNDSLVLVDYINKMRSRGMALREAVLTAGAARFRPVMLTSLTTFIGLMPLLFEKATQAQFLIPMAVSLGFGIIFATFITLILVPVNYLLMESAGRYFAWLKETLRSKLALKR